MKKFVRIEIAFVVGVVALAPLSARADVMGFNNLVGWTYNQSDGGTPADLPNPDTIHITSLGTSQARSIFRNTPQSIAQFVASFTYQAQNASVFGCDYGAAFVLQNSPAHQSALGSSGGGMGYAGITNSIAVTLELQNNASGYFTNGDIGSNGLSVSPLSLPSGRAFNVVLSYDGSLLHQSITDTVSLVTYNRNFIVGDITVPLGGDTAYVGFTASTTQGACSGNAADQYFSNFQFTAVPEPSAWSLLLLGAMLNRRRRQARRMMD